jgi:hypothetical protein
MRLPGGRLLAGIAAAGIVLFTVFGAVAADAAVPTNTHVAGTAVTSGVAAVDVPGLGDYPVTCTNDAVPATDGSGGMVARHVCRADDVASRVKLVCVSPPGATAFSYESCSDLPALITALQAAAAGPPSTNSDQIDFKCNVLDYFCLAQESISRNVAKWATDSISWVFDQSAFDSSSILFTVATDEAGFWWTIVGFVVIAAVAIAIAIAAIAANPKLMVRAFLGLLGTFAITWLAIWGVGKLLDVVDGLTAPILAHGLATGGIQQTVMKLMYPSDFAGVVQSTSPTVIMLSLLALGVGLVIDAFVNSLRNFGLMVLIAFAPLAFSILATKAGSGWWRNWWSAVIALVLTKPLVLGLLVLVLNGTGKVGSLYTIQALPLIIGLFMSLLMPFVAFGLFSFVGAQAAGATDAFGHHAKGAARSAGNAAVRRVGRRGSSGGGSGGVGKTSGGGTPSRPRTAAANPNRGSGGGAAVAPPATSGGSSSGVQKPAAIRDGRFKPGSTN